MAKKSQAPDHRPAPQGFDTTLSFAAGGWFQMFHFGVCQAFVDSGFIRHLESSESKRTVRYCGSSAGSLAAAALASGCTTSTSFVEMKEFALECADHYRESLWNFLCMKEYLIASIHRFGDKIVASRGMASLLESVNGGRLEVYATTLPMLRRRCIDSFEEFADVEEALLASCCLTPVVGFPFQLRCTGEWVCDGGITAFQPRGDEAKASGGRSQAAAATTGDHSLITISPFYFTQADIRPNIFVPAWWGLYPPPRPQHAALFDVGYNSALDYLIRHQLIPAVDGNNLYKAPADLTLGSSSQGLAAMLRDMLVTALYLFIGRPLGILLIYTEMLLMVVLLTLSAAVTASPRWSAVYHNLRNLVSLRVFLRLLFSKKIPINEARLSQSSGFYRALKPLVFEGNKIRRNGGEHSGGGASAATRPKRFIVDTHCNMHSLNFRERDVSGSSSSSGGWSSGGGSILDRAAVNVQQTKLRELT